jgi:hypothetical protein
MGFLEGLQAGWGLGNEISDALDAREVRKLYDEGQAAAAREAANSGRTVDVLPEDQITRGYGVDTADNHYATGRQGVADMIVGQENDIRDLQNGARQEFMRDRAMLDSAGRDKGVRTYALSGADARARTSLAEPPQVREEPRVFERGYATPGGAYAEEKTALPGYGVQTTIPARDQTQIFQEKYLPGVIAKLESQGRVKDAEAFRQWAQDSKNRRFSAGWLDAMTSYRMGDKAGTLLKLQNLYNDQVEDNRHVVLAPSGGNDDTYVVQVRDNDTGNVVRQFTGNYDDIATMGLGVLSPENQAMLMYKANREDAQEARKYLVATPGSHILRGDQLVHAVPTKDELNPGGTTAWHGIGKNPATGQVQYWRMRTDGQIDWGPVAEKVPTVPTRSGGARSGGARSGGARSGGASSGGASSGDKLTLAQQRTNEQVIAARNRVNAMAAAGMNVSEMAKNDKELASALALSRQRLYGNDPDFTAWSSREVKMRDISPLKSYLAADVSDEDRIASARAKGWTREEIRRALAQIKGN